MKYIETLVSFLALGILLSTMPASAEYLAAFEGFSAMGAEPGACPACDSTVSFAVWHNADGNWLDDFPVMTELFGESDGSERYVYLYQIVGTNPVPPLLGDIITFNVTYGTAGASLSSNPFVAGGFFSGISLVNVSTATTPLDDFTDGVPSALVTVSPWGPEKALVLIDPVSLTEAMATNTALEPDMYPAMQFFFEPTIDGDGLGQLEASPLLFLVSNAAPAFVWGETESPPFLGPPGSAGNIPSAVDQDADGINDWTDNCSAVPNELQLDADGDGYGNRCDTDLDNNCFTGFTDLSLFANEFGAKGINAADFDESGFVGFDDLSILAGFFGAAPGPSGIAFACE